jgi:hypothetical protein
MSLSDIFASPRFSPAQFIGGLLFGTAPNGEDHDGGMGPERRGMLLTFSVWLVIVPLVLWLLAYISGLFPYLGYYHYGRHGMLVSYVPTGLNTMILFKGQEAFIHYEVDSEPGFNGQVAVDIRPWPAIGASLAMQRVSGKQSGTVRVIIPETGLYRFHHAAGNRLESLSYTVTWGAK